MLSVCGLGGQDTQDDLEETGISGTRIASEETQATQLAHGEITSMNPIIQTVLDAHFPGVAKPVTMDESDITAELTRLRAENAALRERADVRAIVGELREIGDTLEHDAGLGRIRLRDLLRRLEEPQTGEQI